MKKIMYIIAGLLVLAGLAFALSNTKLFKGTIPEFSFGSSGPEIAIPVVTTTPSTTATVSTPIDFIVDNDATVDSEDSMVDVSVCLLEGQGDPSNSNMVLEYTVYDTEGTEVDNGVYMLDQSTDIQKDPTYSASTNDCLEYEDVFTLNEDTLALSEFDVSFYVDFGDAITETNDENNGTNNNRTNANSADMGYVYAGEDALAFNMYWGDYEETYELELDGTAEVEFCYEGLTDEYTGETAKYYVYLDGTQINSQYIELTADDCNTYEFTPDTNMTITEAGEYQVSLVIDEDEDFDESSEDDNGAKMTFVVSDSAADEISCSLTITDPSDEISKEDIEYAYIEWSVELSEGEYKNAYGVQAYDSDGNALTDRGGLYDSGDGDIGTGGIADTEGFAETSMYYSGEAGDYVTIWTTDYPACSATVTSEKEFNLSFGGEPTIEEDSAYVEVCFDGSDDYNTDGTYFHTDMYVDGEYITTRGAIIQESGCVDYTYTAAFLEITETGSFEVELTLDPSEKLTESKEDDNVLKFTMDYKADEEEEEEEDQDDEEEKESPFEPDSAADDAYDQAIEAGLSYEEAVEVGHRIQDEADGRSEENIQALIESVIQEYIDAEVEELKDRASDRLNGEDLEGDYITAILDQITEDHLDMTDEEFEEWLNEELEAARAEQEEDQFEDAVREELLEEGELTQDEIEEVIALIDSDEMEMSEEEFDAWLAEVIVEVLRPEIDLAFGDVNVNEDWSYNYEVCLESGESYEDHASVTMLAAYYYYDADAADWVIDDFDDSVTIDFHTDTATVEGDCVEMSPEHTFPVDDTQSYKLSFVIDYYESLEETDETNNSFEKEVDPEEAAEAAYDAMVEFIEEYLEEEGLTEEQIAEVLDEVNEDMLDWDQETGMAWLEEQVEAATGTDEDDDTEDDQDADAETIAALEEALEAAIAAAEAAAAAAEAAEAAASSSGGDTYITYESSGDDDDDEDEDTDDADEEEEEDTTEDEDDTDEDEDEDTEDDFPFPDVDPDTWEGEAILTLYEMGIMKGDEDGNARPWDYANRAEVLAMLMRSLYDEAVLELMSFEVTFADVPDSAWYYNHVHAALKLGVIEEAEFFNPATPMTRAEFVHALVNAANELCTTCTADFTDVERSDWYYRALATALDAQIVSGFEDGTFLPNDYINRAGVAAIIVKALNADWVGR